MQALKNGTVLNIELSGPINGETKMPSYSLVGVKDIVINFDKVELINSIGVRLFVNFLREFPSGMNIIFTHCKRFIVDQINLIVNFKPKNAKVESLYVPYFCENCSQVYNILYHYGQNYDTSGKVTHPEKVMCPQCNVPLSPEIIENKYFSFLSK